MPDDSTAPSRDLLKKLHGSLKGFIQVRDNRVVPKHQNKATLARQFCPVCAKLHDFVYRDASEEVQPGNCPECQKQFDDGCFAAVCAADKRYAFLKGNNKTADLVGKIVKVEVETMNVIEKQHGASYIKTEANNLPKTASCFTCKYDKQESEIPPCKTCRWGNGEDDAKINWEPNSSS